MLTLLHRESCPYSAKVRQVLEDQHLSYVSIPVEKLGSERHAVLKAVPNSAVVPVLIDGDTVITDSAEIIRYLKQHHAQSDFGDPTYGITRRLTGVSFADAVSKTRTALAAEGFGVLTEIDIKATLKKKLDADFRPYLILGACNPPLAHRALTEELPIGLLLPCNVVITEEKDGSIIVSTIDPRAMFSVVKGADMSELVDEVRGRLTRVIQSL